MNMRVTVNYFIFFLSLFFCSSAFAVESLSLIDNLQKTDIGDYVVLSSQKNLTLMNIVKKGTGTVVIEEVSVSQRRFPSYMSWREWISRNAPGNHHWVVYEIDLKTGQMRNYYSFTKGGWFEIPDQDNQLTKLLNLNLTKLPLSERKMIGHRRARCFWQPKMIVDGSQVEDVFFDVWTANWPKDNSPLSEKTVELYIPGEEDGDYPSYFPYWLEIAGTVSNFKIRIVDSGKNLHSPKTSPL